MPSKPRSLSPSLASMALTASRMSPSGADLSNTSAGTSAFIPSAHMQADARIRRVSSSSGSMSSSATLQPAGFQSYSLKAHSLPFREAASFTSVPPMSMPISMPFSARTGTAANTGVAAASSAWTGTSGSSSTGWAAKANRASGPHREISVRWFTFRHLP